MPSLPCLTAQGDCPLSLVPASKHGEVNPVFRQVSVIFDEEGVGYMYYTAVGGKGRGIGLLTSKPMQ